MTKTTTTAVEVRSLELQKSLDIILAKKADIDKVGEQCLKIVITDDNTLAVAQQNLSKANELAKFIEESRVKIKAPYLAASKTIDDTAKLLTDTISKGIAHIKTGIIAWEKKCKEEAAKKAAELEAKLAADRSAIEAEENRKKAISERLAKASCKLKNDYTTLIDAEKCSDYLKVLNKNWPDKAVWMEFFEDAQTLKDTYIGLITEKMNQFEGAESLSEAEIEIALEREAILLERAALTEREAKLKMLEEETENEKKRKMAEEEAERQRQKSAAEAAMNKVSGIRKTWKMELVDPAKLLPEWIAMDEVKVKEWFKENKDKIKDGEIVNGVKFYQESGVVA